MIAWLLNKVGPKGKEFGMYSLDYHTIRNYLYVNRIYGKERAKEHIPSYAMKVVEEYEGKNGDISKRLKL
jgi:7-hydroxymethyl chlorophyll a reductase